MYPESTLYDISERSHLKVFDSGSSIYQSFDISMPYIMIYEAVNPATDLSIYQEYSESKKIVGQNPYHNFMTRSLKLHYHNFYELTFVLSGTLNMQIEDETISYHQGDCCLCNKNIHHLELMDENTEIIILLMKEEFILELCQRNVIYDEKGHAAPIKTIFDQFFVENGKNAIADARIYANYHLKNTQFFELIVRLTNQMVEEVTGSRSGKSYMMKALICRFLDLLNDDTIYQQNIHRAKLSHAEQIIFELLTAYQNKDGLFTRQEIEKITGYNSDHVERLVKKHTGKTLSDFGRSILLKRSEHLLVNSDMSITDICLKQGYTNRHYFNKIFVKEYGMTPSEYRKATKR